MCRLNHGIAVDYYALGVIAYEFMFGRVCFIFIFIRKIILIRDLIWGEIERKFVKLF